MLPPSASSSSPTAVLLRGLQCANCLGESPYSQPFSTCTQASVPSPPAMPLVVAASESSVILQWEAPPDNGAEITGYQLEMDDGR